jgi:predicted thioesterase
MAELMFEVTESDTAEALGSGDVAVLATPRLVAWCEAATLTEAAVVGVVAPGETTVGTRVVLDHLAASVVGARVRVVAHLTRREGRTLRFEVTARDDATGRELAVGEVTRAAVDRDRFLSRLTR